MKVEAARAEAEAAADTPSPTAASAAELQRRLEQLTDAHDRVTDERDALRARLCGGGGVTAATQTCDVGGARHVEPTTTAELLHFPHADSARDAFAAAAAQPPARRADSGAALLDSTASTASDASNAASVASSTDRGGGKRRASLSRPRTPPSNLRRSAGDAPVTRSASAAAKRAAANDGTPASIPALGPTPRPGSAPPSSTDGRRLPPRAATPPASIGGSARVLRPRSARVERTPQAGVATPDASALPSIATTAAAPDPVFAVEATPQAGPRASIESAAVATDLLLASGDTTRVVPRAAPAAALPDVAAATPVATPLLTSQSDKENAMDCDSATSGDGAALRTRLQAAEGPKRMRLYALHDVRSCVCRVAGGLV